MGVKVRVENHARRTLPFDTVKMTSDLLDIVPPDHLAKLDAVLLVDSIKINGQGAAEGIYRPKRRGGSASIEISMDEVVQQISSVLYYSSYF
jgi:hypothetical protein